MLLLAISLALLQSPPAAGAIADPMGDTFGAGPDITSVSTSLVGMNQNTLQITVGVAGPIFAPSTFNLNEPGSAILFSADDGNCNHDLAMPGHRR